MCKGAQPGRTQISDKYFTNKLAYYDADLEI